MLSSVNSATKGVGIGRGPNVDPPPSDFGATGSRGPAEAEGRDDLVVGGSYAFMVSIRWGRLQVATMPSTMYCATKGVGWWTGIFQFLILDFGLALGLSRLAGVNWFKKV